MKTAKKTTKRHSLVSNLFWYLGWVGANEAGHRGGSVTLIMMEAAK